MKLIRKEGTLPAYHILVGDPSPAVPTNGFGDDSVSKLSQS